MNSKDLIRLGVVAVVALGAALWIAARREPGTVADAGGALAPGLKESVNEVKTVRLIGAGNKPIATLVRNDSGWTVTERAGFGADAAKVRELLLRLADAQLVEAKTAKPELCKKLGVEDVSAPDAIGLQVEIEGPKKPVKIIVGRPNTQGGEGAFVRRAGEAQSFLARGNLAIDKNTGEWLKRDLADIPSSRIATVELSGDGKTLKAYKNSERDANFLVADLPKGRELSSEYAANALGAVLAQLRFDDVKPRAEAQPPADARGARYKTFDGITVSGKVWEAEQKNYAQFEVAFDEAAAQAAVERAQAKELAEYAEKSAAAPAKEGEPAPAKPEPPLASTDKAKDAAVKLDKLRAEVADLKTRFEGWTFVLPAFKYANMHRSLEDLLKPVESKDAKKPSVPLVPPKG